MRTKFVVCESVDGWSLHAPDSTDEEIACGDAPPLVSGPWEDGDRAIPAGAYAAAEHAMKRHESIWGQRRICDVGAACAEASRIDRWDG